MTSPIAKRPPAAFFQLTTDQWTKPFWDAAVLRRLSVSSCGHCGLYRMPPSPFCPRCRSQLIDWIDLSGRGIIYSYTIVTRAILPEMETSLPYVPAVIELDGTGGARFISNIVEVPIDAVAVGAAVRVVWDDVRGVTVPRFTLAP
jgi:uncharacterized OB-fold protein